MGQTRYTGKSPQHPIISLFNLENIIFQVVVVGQFHSITSCYTFGNPLFEAFSLRAQHVKNQQPPVTYDMGNREEVIKCTLKDTLTAKNGDVSSSPP